jgi:hypothetical protein
MSRHGARDDVHVTYRMADGGEAQTIVTEDMRDALQQQGALLADHGSSRLLASMDSWPNIGGRWAEHVDRLRRPQ